MELILWRHADAEYGLPDLDRPLSNKGFKQARRMADFLRSRLPDNARIMVSPALRTQQTAAALGLSFTIEPLLAPNCSSESMLQVIGRHGDDCCTVIVGHQPALGRLASWLLTGSDSDMCIKKGAAWWFVARQPAWERGTAILRCAMSAEVLRANTFSG